MLFNIFSLQIDELIEFWDQEHEFTAKDQAWAVNTISWGVNSFLGVKMQLTHLISFGINPRTNQKSFRDLKHIKNPLIEILRPEHMLQGRKLLDGCHLKP